MTSPGEAAPRGTGTVFVLAPTGRDAAVAVLLLGREGVPARACATLGELCAALDEETGAVLVAEEAFAGAAIGPLARWLEAQPPWSDLPFLVLARGLLASGRPRPEAGMRLAGLLGNAMLLERPLGAWALASAVRAALRARHRQWQVRDHLAEREETAARLRLLLAELNHRVKNTLAVVQGIAGLTLSGGDAVKEARGAFVRRLAALGAAHTLLTESGWHGADLRALLAGELAPYGGRASIAGEVELTLGPKAATTLSLVLHELATNATKHGALSVAEGRLEVGWRVLAGDGPERLLLAWREDGGPPVRRPARHGFGLTLLERIAAHDLGGHAKLAFNREGVRYTLEAPLARLTSSD